MYADSHSAIYIIFIWALSTNAMMNLIPMVLISVELTGQVVDSQWLYLVVGSLVLENKNK